MIAFFGIMGFLPLLWGLFTSILWAAAVSYGAYLIGQLFVKKPKDRAGKIGSLPIQYCQKGNAIPKVYGCERLAGNIIWMGPQGWYEKKTHQPHVDGNPKVGTYYRSFLIGLAEGSGNITKIWNGKRLLWSSSGGATENESTNEQTRTFGPAATDPDDLFPLIDGTVYGGGGDFWNDILTAKHSLPGIRGVVLMSKGDGTQDARFYTGEDFGKYDDLIWCYFQDFENLPGSGSAIPNFIFEVCTGTSYKYTYISDNGDIYGVPLFGSTCAALDVGGVAVDVGGGVSSIPYAGHPFLAGEVVEINGTDHYDGKWTLLESTTANELHITKAFQVETFDGTETVCKYIVTTASAGRMSVDTKGNVWYGHNFDGTSCYWKIAPDGTITHDDLDNNWTGDIGWESFFSADGKKIYVHCPQSKIQKYDLATGDMDWENGESGGGFAAAIDADENVYLGNTSPSNDATMYESDGTEHVLTGFGSVTDAPWGGLNATRFSMTVDDSIGILIGGGLMYTPVASGEDAPYNLCVMDLNDHAAIAKMTLGGTYLDLGDTIYRTYRVATGKVTTLDGFIYVLSDTPTSTLYKIKWTPPVYNALGVISEMPTLEIIDSVVLPASFTGVWADESGNLVLMASVDADRLWFYDSELNYLKKISNLPNGLADGWDVSSWIEGNHCPYPGTGNLGASDENPAVIINDLAQNNRYGAGIAQQYINNASISEEYAYWEGQLYRISLALTEQMPLTDWIDYVLSHCNGYRFWSEGKLNIGAFKNEASIASLTTDDLVRDEGEDPPPPVSFVKRKLSETFNRVNITWTDREHTYDAAIATQQDEVDQRVSGKLRTNAIELAGIHNIRMAQKMAIRYIFDNMYRFTTYAFKVGYKRMLLMVGDVIDVTDGSFLVCQRMRIVSREEDVNGRFIAIEALEDIEGNYPAIEYADAQQTEADPGTPVAASDLVSGSLAFREDLIEGMLYVSFAPGDDDTTGADIYRSYDGVNYEYVGRVVLDQYGVANSAGVTTCSMPRAKAVIHRYSESFTVDIGTVNSLRTDVTDDEFFANQNLAKIGDEIIAWKTAEDLGSGVWRITQLIRGMFGTEAVEHASGAAFKTLSPIDFYYEFTDEVAGQTLYFKALSTHRGDVGQSLDDVTATEYTVQLEHDRPASLSAQTVEDQRGIETVDSFPVVVSFNLASRIAGFNLGGKGAVGWGAFTKDSRIAGVNVKIKTLAGVQIGFEYLDLDGYHADDYELTVTAADRAGNDPVIIELEPVTSLPARKPTGNMIDLV